MGGWHTEDVQSSMCCSLGADVCAALPVRQEKTAGEGVCFCHTGHSVCGARKKGAVLSLLQPLSALLRLPPFNACFGCLLLDWSSRDIFPVATYLLSVLQQGKKMLRGFL